MDIENDEGYRELSLRRAQINTAWQDIKEKMDSGEVITTKVVNINKGGLIVEQGRHEDLLKDRGGLYRRYAEHQVISSLT